MPRPPLLRLHDDALPAPLFARLARAVKALGTQGLARTYETTFWFPLDAAPAAVTEEAALALLRRIPRHARRRLAGVEWWLSRMRTSDVRVDFHQDRDERLALRTGRLVHPVLSSVLFLNRCRGGLLAVLDAPPDPRNPACAPDPFDADLARPAPNRLAVFPGDATHGVLDARGRIPHGRLGTPTPLRLALVLNWWARRPTGVPRFANAPRRYESLGAA